MEGLPPGRRDAYLRRIGIAGVPPPTAVTLRALQAAHLRAVPFENLDIHLGRPIPLDADRAVRKIVTEHRGGWCYEQNAAFAALLTTLGFAPTLLEAQVHGDDGPGLRFDHLCLRVDLTEAWLVDVGFGDHADHPLRLTTDDTQRDPVGDFRLVASEDGAPHLDLLRDGRPQQRIHLAPRLLSDFAPGNIHHQTAPTSHFTSGWVCSRRTDVGRVTLRGRRLIETDGGRRQEREVADVELGPLLAQRFGIALDAHSLQRLIASLS